MPKKVNSVRVESYKPRFERVYDGNVKDLMGAWGATGERLQKVEIDAQPKFGAVSGIGAVDTGLMRASAGSRVSGRSVHIGNIAHYSIYVTMGTWKMPKRPFLQNAVSAKYKNDYLSDMKKNMRF